VPLCGLSLAVLSMPYGSRVVCLALSRV